MPRPALRSTSLRKIKKRAPGGRRILHYVRKNPKQAKCALCKKPLKGVPRGASKIRKLTKSKKKPTRKFGGYLCSKCSREKIKNDMLLAKK